MRANRAPGTVANSPQVVEEEDGEPSERPRQRRRPDDNDEEEAASDDSNEPETANRDDSGETQLVKKLVRYALACDYSRVPIRRDGIRDRVLGPHGRSFKKIFEGAQKQLREVFGMEMEELPVRDKETMSLGEKRKGAS